MVCLFFLFFASYRLLPRYQLVDQTSLHGTQELVAGQSSVEIYQSSEQEWIDISSQVNSGFMTDWTAKGVVYMFFFVVIVLCTAFGRLAWVGGSVGFVWRTERIMIVRDWAVIFPSSAFWLLCTIYGGSLYGMLQTRGLIPVCGR